MNQEERMIDEANRDIDRLDKKEQYYKRTIKSTFTLYIPFALLFSCAFEFFLDPQHTSTGKIFTVILAPAGVTITWCMAALAQLTNKTAEISKSKVASLSTKKEIEKSSTHEDKNIGSSLLYAAWDVINSFIKSNKK